MSFLHVDPNVLKVPGRMDLDELSFLAALARSVPNGGHIVEIGPFYGRSTNAMARANQDARISSIDTFENVAWTGRYAEKYKEVPEFGRGAFDRFTAGLTNVRAIEGNSPACVQDWAEPIDLYFEDSVHGNPGLKANLDFWIARLKPGGIACGHDYTRRFPDVKREVDRLAARWNTKPWIVGSLWALQKPGTSEAMRPPGLTCTPNLAIQTDNRRKGRSFARSGYWCGAHLDADRLNWFDIVPAPGLEGLEYRLGHTRHGETGWIPAGTPARLVSKGLARPFSRFAVRFAPGTAPPDLRVMYRGSARQIGNGGARLSGTTAWTFDGAWARLPVEGPALNAIAITLVTEPLPDQQSAFTPKTQTIWRQVTRDVARRVLAQV